jgi:long-chain acyl-CoA synthetase
LLAAASPIPDAMAGRDDLAGIFYTGGTTGRSKGVMLSHGNLMADALQFLAEGLFSRDDVYLHAAPMFHLANGAAMYQMLLNAGTNAIIKAFSPEAVAQAIERYRVTYTLLVPTMIQMFVDHPGIGGRDLSSLRQIVYGASPISEALLDRAMANLPGVRFVQAYGMTELSPAATVLMPEELRRKRLPPSWPTRPSAGSGRLRSAAESRQSVTPTSWPACPSRPTMSGCGRRSVVSDAPSVLRRPRRCPPPPSA